jgi:uncharacterized membrane protein HdeD (DUF308 family)
MSQTADPGSYTAPPGITRLAEHWGVVLAYGLVTLAVGVMLLVWPSATVTVLAVLLAIQLIVGGLFRIVGAVAMERYDAGVRALIGLSGGLALIVGLLVLRQPLQSVVVLGMVVGAWWVVAGVVDIIGALLAPGASTRRGWDVLGGAVTLLAGGVLLVYADVSLRVLVVLVAVSMILTGALATAAALRLRSDAEASW